MPTIAVTGMGFPGLSLSLSFTSTFHRPRNAVTGGSVLGSQGSCPLQEAAGGGQWIGANVAAVESELTEVRKLGTFWPGSTGRPRTSLKPGGTPVRKLSLPGTLPRPAPCLLGRSAMTNLSSILKSKDVTLPTKVCMVKAMVFPVVTYGYQSWTIKKAEC